MIVLLKLMCFKEFLGLKVSCLLSERQARVSDTKHFDYLLLEGLQG